LSSQTYTHADKVKRVDEVINRLGLRGCAESLVGTELLRGISGGEKKRTNLGRELVTDPKIIFLDEPTTGLDAKTAGTVIDILADLAKNKHKTVVLSIHQPKYSIWKRFDALILLHEGRVAYHGPAHGHTHTGTGTQMQGGGGALMYFEKLGFVREMENNPADWLLEVVSLPAPLVHTEGERDTHTHARARLEADASGGSETGSSEEEEEEGGDGDVEMGVLFSSNSTTMAAEDETKDATAGVGKIGLNAHTHTHTTLTTSTSSSLTDIYLLSPEYLHLQQQLSTLLHQSQHTGTATAKVSPSSPYATTLL
jgi:ABC-type multidrug transport system ATPase subunit